MYYVIHPIFIGYWLDTKHPILDKKRGIEWTTFYQLEDLDFADDIAILSTTTSKHLQEKTNILINYAKKIGLNVNAKKTKVISINTWSTTPITINLLPVDSVEYFTYFGSIITS